MPNQAPRATVARTMPANRFQCRCASSTLSAVCLVAAVLSLVLPGEAAMVTFGPPPAGAGHGRRVISTTVKNAGVTFKSASTSHSGQVTLSVHPALPRGAASVSFTARTRQGGSQLWLVLQAQDAGKTQRYRLGLGREPFLDQWRAGRWKRLYHPWRWHADPSKPVRIQLTRLGDDVFIELGASRDLAAVLPFTTQALSLTLVARAPANHALDASITNLRLAAIKNKPASATSPLGPWKKQAYVNLLGWMPPNYLGGVYRLATDFPLYAAPSANAEQLKLMARYGWTGVAADFLFLRPAEIRSQYNLMKNLMDEADQLKLKHFTIVPFLETRRADVAAAGVRYLLRRLGGNPRWGKIDGRPIIFTYGAQNKSLDFWKKVIDASHRDGYNPIWIFELGGLNPALFGRFNVKKYTLYMKLFDGAFNFGASALEKGADMPANLRKAYGHLKAHFIVGASIWPDYLSCRPDMRNFNSPRGTAFLRHVWNTTLATRPLPDFVHFSVWNDFGESTTLSRSYSILTSRLEISQRYLCRYFHRPLPEGNQPESVLSYRKDLYQGEPIKFEFLPLPTRNGPAKGIWHIVLRDETGNLIDQATSPTVPLNTMIPWKWQLTKGVRRADTRVVKVRVSLQVNDRTIRYANLPDIAVAVPVSYADQLYYSIPLHRLAPAGRGVRIQINGSDHDVVPASGLRRIDYRITGANGADVQVASMRDSHAWRMLAPLNKLGATLHADTREATIVWRNRPAHAPTGRVDWYPSATDGQDYYAAVAHFPDGTWAYSSTVWTVPPVPHQDTAAQWVFAPTSIKHPRTIVDRSGHHHTIILPKSADLSFVKLPGGAKALAFDGKVALHLPTALAPDGPLTVELLFRPDRVDRQQVLFYQRGAQAALILDRHGYLIARRLPARRSYPHPFVQVRSKTPIPAHVFCDAVVSFDGKTLRLFVNGKLRGQISCQGTRSTEGAVLGGPFTTGDLSETLDDIQPTAFFHGTIVRLSIYANALSPDTIAGISRRARVLPFWDGLHEAK